VRSVGVGQGGAGQKDRRCPPPITAWHRSWAYQPSYSTLGPVSIGMVLTVFGGHSTLTLYCTKLPLFYVTILATLCIKGLTKSTRPTQLPTLSWTGKYSVTAAVRLGSKNMQVAHFNGRNCAIRPICLHTMLKTFSNSLFSGEYSLIQRQFVCYVRLHPVT